LTVRIEALGKADAPAFLPLLHAEGWLFEPRDLERLLELPGGGIAAWLEGRLVGGLTVLLHDRLAWIGNVVVSPAQRGKGVAQAMLEHALLRFGQGRSVRLCSVLPARSLYLRLGFRAEGPCATFAGPAQAASKAEGVERGAAHVADVVAYDRRAFGADRSALLSRLAKEFPDGLFVARDGARVRGYVLLRAGPAGGELGPWIADDDATAEALLDAALSRVPVANLEATVPTHREASRRMLLRRGLEERFPTVLMVRGNHRMDLARTYGLCALEKG